jgi:hypothetical protein
VVCKNYNKTNEIEKARSKAEKETKIMAQRKSLEENPVAPLTDKMKSTALKTTSEVINWACDMALDVHGATASKDIFWSVNFGSVWVGPTDDDYTFVTTNENLAHICQPSRLFFQSNTTGWGLKLGEEYTLLEFKISQVANLTSLKSKLSDGLDQARKAGQVCVATFQLVAPCGYKDAKYVEKQGFNKLRENDKIIPMEDTSTYNAGGQTSSRSDRGVTSLTVVFDACNGVKEGKVLFCSTSSTQAFMNTVMSRVPCASKSGWGVLGHPGKTLAMMKPAAMKPSGALDNLDPNASVPPPPPKKTKRPTPKQLKGMIVVKTGTTTKTTKQLKELFDSYDEAEFRTTLPVIDGTKSIRERVILLVGNREPESGKVRNAEELGVKTINEEEFMQMLAS